MSEWGRASGSPIGSEWKARDMQEHRDEMREQVERDGEARRAHAGRRRRWWPLRRSER